MSNNNVHPLVEYILINGKKESWFEYAERFNIRPRENRKARAKAANDIWRNYLRSAKEESPTAVYDIRGTVKKVKEWETYSGEKRRSVEYVPQEVGIGDVLESFKAEAAKFAPNYSKFPEPKVLTTNPLLEISIFDLHFDKLCWAEETGNNYDKKIAEGLYFDAISYFAGLARAMEVSKILLPIGNDFFNSEGFFPQTTNGTPQETDSRWQDSFTHGWKMLVKAIDFLSTIAPVDIVIVPGNHDATRTYYLGSVLDAWYNSHRFVTVNNAPTSRKYYRFGKNLLGFTHGDQEKPTDLPMIMASECREVWGEVKHTEWHLGHIHRYQSQEIFGVHVRFLPSLCGTDAWHKQKGFIGNNRAAQAYLFDYNNGYIAHFQYTVNGNS